MNDKNKKTTAAKPFLKWAGGKSQLLETFSAFYPLDLKAGNIANYYEPFLGGGAVFFEVAQKFNIKSAFLYDINEELILVYLVIQNNVYELVEELFKIKNKYEKLPADKQSAYYYNTRDTFNRQGLKFNYNRYSKHWVKRASQLVFLNKTCFNGLFRFNTKGEFNTPAGRYKNPKILDENNLVKTSEILSIAEIKKASFQEVVHDIKEKSFVYYDPPYRPINKTSAFTAYSKYAFGNTQQFELANLFKQLNELGIQQMLSNSDPKNHNSNDNFFDDLYADYNIFRVSAKRMINSVAKKRNAISELIITNYPVS